MTEQNIRHTCVKHPHNAFNFLRAEPTLAGAYAWHLLGLDRTVEYCPWCGVNLEELRLLQPSAAAQVARALGVLREQPSIEWLSTATPVPSSPGWIIFPLEPGKTRTEVAHCKRAGEHNVFRFIAGGDNAGVIVESLAVLHAGEVSEQLIAGACSIELFDPRHDPDAPAAELDIPPGAVLLARVHNAGDTMSLIQFGLSSEGER